jgi:hypothetical protein
MTEKYAHNFEKFKSVLCENSISDDYNNCVNEWKLSHISRKEDNCICCVNITRRYHIKNIHNNKKLIVGCICVKKFMNSNDQLITDVNKQTKIFEKNQYNTKCKISRKLFRKCDTCLKKYKINRISDHDNILECKKCNIGIHTRVNNIQYKEDCKMYRICDKCNVEYKLFNISNHDTLLECEKCDLNSHIKEFNEHNVKEKKAVRRCIDCGYRYPLKDNKMNTWQIRCYKCYFV